MKRYWAACGPWLGTARFFRRAVRYALDRVSTAVWRRALADLGEGTLVQSHVVIEHPKRVRIGRACLLTSGAWITSETSDGHLRIADRVQVNRDARLDHTGGLTLLEGALVSEGAVVMTHDHGHDPHSAPNPVSLTIGRHAWIGAHAIVLPGVRSIGDHALVGAGAIVTHAVPAYAIVAGNPAREVGSRRTGPERLSNERAAARKIG